MAVLYDDHERDRLRAALEAIDDTTDCTGWSAPQGHPVADLSGPCFEAWPVDPDEWCASCIAHVALAGGA